MIYFHSLMEKYSKKLVSKCIYIQILKCTETDLLGEFMAAGGWNLVHNWLSDGNASANWAFVKEILEMLLLCPVDGNRLKSNHTPKIVKQLSVTCHDQTVKLLASKLVEQWLKIAQQEKQQIAAAQVHNGTNGVAQNAADNVDNSSETTNGKVTDSKSEEKQSKENVKYKISNKEGSGKLLLSLKRSLSPSPDEKDAKISRSSSVDSKSKSDTDKEKSKHKKSSNSSSRKLSNTSKSSHRDKERSSSVSSSSQHRSSSSSKDKSKDKSKSGSSKRPSSSSSSRDKNKDKDKDRERRKDPEKSQAEKDKETLNFLAPLSSSKLQRIPKRQQSENSENKSAESNKDSADQSPNKIAKPSESVERKKPSISIEVRKGEKPKTVKTLNSQFRNHGLAEEPPKPPSRRDLKKPASVVTPTVLSTQALSAPTIKLSTSPPPKKIHIEKSLESEVPERFGGVKLIKPKRKLQQIFHKHFDCVITGATMDVFRMDFKSFLNSKYLPQKYFPCASLPGGYSKIDIFFMKISEMMLNVFLKRFTRKNKGFLLVGGVLTSALRSAKRNSLPIEVESQHRNLPNI